MNFLTTFLKRSGITGTIEMIELRSMIVQKVLGLAQFLIIPGLLAAVLGRGEETSIFTTIAVAGALAIGMAALFRHKLPYHVLALTICGVSFIMMISQYLGWGLSGAGGLWLLVGIIAALLLLDWRSALLMYAAGLLVIGITALAVQFGGYRFPLDFNEFGHSGQVWLAELLATGTVCAAIIGALHYILSYLGKQIHELSEQRETLEDAAQQLQQEIFEHTQTTRDLESVLDDLKEIDRMKDTFVSNVSHELRTPIANLRLYLQLSEKRPDKLAEYLQTMNKEVKRLDSIVEQMLYVAKIQDTAEFGTWAQFDLQGMIQGVVDHYAQKAVARGLTLSYQPLPAMTELFGSANMIQQMVRALVDNAIKYTPASGEIHIQCLEETREPANLVGFRIINTLTTISADERQKVFERFYRGRAAMERHVPGAGLGLSTSRQIVTLHHGLIRLDSSEQEQVSITVLIPARPIQETLDTAPLA